MVDCTKKTLGWFRQLDASPFALKQRSLSVIKDTTRSTALLGNLFSQSPDTSAYTCDKTRTSISTADATDCRDAVKTSSGSDTTTNKAILDESPRLVNTKASSGISNDSTFLNGEVDGVSGGVTKELDRSTDTPFQRTSGDSVANHGSSGTESRHLLTHT